MVMAAARVVPVERRGVYLERLAAELAGKVVGPGLVHRVAVKVARELAWEAPAANAPLSVASRRRSRGSGRGASHWLYSNLRLEVAALSFGPRKRRTSGHFLTAASCHKRTLARQTTSLLRHLVDRAIHRVLRLKVGIFF